MFNVIDLCLILWSCFPISARMLCFLMDYPTALKMLTSLNTLRSLRMGKYQRFNWKKKEKKRAELKKALQNLMCPWFLFRYSQSKWVAEQLVLRARTQGLPVVIYRLGTKRESNDFTATDSECKTRADGVLHSSATL